jgi:site-specific recombinase XerD
MRDVVKFLYHTGCRPQELRAIEGRWVVGQKIVLPLSKSKGGKKRRVIFLDSMAHAIVVRLARCNHTGPLFLNSHGRRWTKNSLGLAFHRLRQRAGISTLCAYQFRHSYITRLLERGVDVATVAAVSGNSPAMVLEVYNHVAVNERRLLSIVRA